MLYKLYNPMQQVREPVVAFQCLRRREIEKSIKLRACAVFPGVPYVYYCIRCILMDIKNKLLSINKLHFLFIISYSDLKKNTSSLCTVSRT